MNRCLPVVGLTVSLWAASGACQEISPPAWVGVYGHYAATISGWLGEMGLDYQVMTREEFAPENLRDYQLVIISRAIEKQALGGDEVAALETYVREGGRLIASAVNIPPGGAFPRLEGTGYAEGWGSDLVLADPESLLASAFGPDKAVAYSGWSSGFRQLPDGELDVWAVYAGREGEGPALALSPGAQAGKPAIFAGEHGEGRCIWCGPHLGSSAGPPWDRLFRAMVEYLLPEASQSAFAAGLMADVPIEHDATKVTGDVVAVLDDPDLPRSALPQAVSAEFVVAALRTAGRQVQALTVAEALQHGLDPSEYTALVWLPGESAPVELMLPLKRYLAGGGGLVLPAGIPFAKLWYRENGTWKPYGRGPRLLALYQQLLPFTKYYHAVFPPARCVNLAPDLLPDLPDVWELSGGDVSLYPYIPNGFSTRTVRKLAVSISGSGEVCGVPLWINDADPRFPCARVLALGFRGESHPWNPDAWDHAEAAVVSFVDLACRKRQVVVKDLWTERACYRDMEPVRVHVEVAATVPGTVRLAAAFAERDSGRRVYETDATVNVQPGTVAEAVLTWAPKSFSTWAYDVQVAAQQDGSQGATDYTLFTVWDDDVLRACPEFTLDNGRLHRNGRPEWLAGVNLYLNDARSVSAFWGNHPLPDFWDRDLSYQDLVGANANRQHYLQRRITIDGLKTGEDSEGLSIADAYCMVTAAHHGWTRLGVNVHRLNWNAQESGTFPPREKWDDQEFWLSSMARRYRDAPHLHWEIINEPKEQDPSIHDWVGRMRDAVVQETGELPSCSIGWSGFHGVWSPQGAPRGLPYHDLHFYTPDGDRSGDGLSTAYAMNLAWPALMGELGMPNASTSAETELGDWGAIYDRMLHYLIGERGIGFLNFYLTNTSSPTGNEWGLLHHDLVEKESAHAFKRWLFVLRRLRKEEYLPADSLMVYSMDQYADEPAVVSRRLRQDFASAFNAGFRPRLLDERDLAAWPTKPGVAFIPGWSRLSAEALQALRALNDQGCRLVAVGDAESATEGLPCVGLDEVKPRWEVDISPELARVWYVLPKQDGGQTVVLIDGSRETGTVGFRGHALTTTVEPGRSSVFDFAPDGSLCLAEAWGDLAIDGRNVVSGGTDGYALASLDGKPLFSGGAIALDAPDQSAVQLASAPANSIAALRAVLIQAPQSAAYDAAVDACRSHLEELGVDVSVRRGELPAEQHKSNLVIIGSPAENPEAARAGRACPELPLEWRGNSVRPCLKIGRARTWYPWTGAITVAPNPWGEGTVLILVHGLSRAGTQIACRKFASLAILDSYAVGPTVRLRDDLRKMALTAAPDG